MTAPVIDDIDILFPGGRLLPLAYHRNGTQRVIEHTPGPLRPFAATLATAQPTAGKDEKPQQTRRTTRQTEETILDGKAQTDQISDDVTD